jgi:hypothetical protein
MTAFLGMDRKAFALALGLATVFIALSGPARADEGPGWLTKVLGLRTDAPVSPAFVQKTRPAKSDYVPVHTPRIGPQSRPMSRDQVVAQEKSLDSSLNTHNKIVGRAGTKTGKSVADGPADQKQRGKKLDSCEGLTCANPSLLPAQPGREYR